MNSAMRQLWGRSFIISSTLLLGCAIGEAQQRNKIPRIGILESGSSANPTNDKAFREALRELGYVVGETIHLEYKYADGDINRLTALAAEFVESKIDVIRTGGTQTTVAARRATSTIPIVVGGAGDLVATKLVDCNT